MKAEEELRILIIDDDEAVRGTMVDYLEDYEFEVYQAGNGVEGLRLFKERAPDVILTDLRMPEMDGLEFLAQIREVSPDIPVIVISGTGNISDSVQALRAGASDYIIKPIYDMSIVLVAIEKTMEKARLIQSNKLYQENLENLVRDRTEALEEANKRLSELNIRLRQIITSTSELAKCVDVNELGYKVVVEFTRHMDANGGSLFLIEEKGLRLIYTNEPDHVPRFLPFPLNENSVISKVLREGKPVLIEDINRYKDIRGIGREEYRNGSVLTFPLPDESGKIIGVITLHNKTRPPFVEQDREIGSILASFSRETLRAVQNSETIRINAEQQTTIMNSLHTGIIVVDPETDAIVDANSEATRLIGLTDDELLGRRWADFLNTGDCGDRDMLEGPNTSDNVESVLLTRDHREIPVLRTVVPVLLQGRVHHLESFVDISANKEIEKEKEKLEAQLIQSQKMEAIGTLAGGLAHDLNNTLNGIVSPVSMLLHKLDNNISIPRERMKTQLGRIQYASSRITDMVSQLMAVAQKEELSLAPVDLNLSIKHVVKLVRGTFDKSIEVVARLPEKPAVTNADPTRIEQMLLNLCINASHAMTIMRAEGEKWGGKLEIEIRRIRVDKSFGTFPTEIADGEYWLIMVSDTGVGITEEELVDIFTPFYTTKDKDQGTGLGLTMVFNIAQQHQGAVVIDSKPGTGSVFNVFLPDRDVTPSESKAKVDYESLRGDDKTVLIVDDEKNVRDVMREILGDLGYSIFWAENGEQALDVLKNNLGNIDLILLDLIMPKMSGDEAYQKIREFDLSVPVLLVSGFKQDSRAQALLRDDDVMFLQKPFDMYSLAETVKSALS